MERYMPADLAQHFLVYPQGEAERHASPAAGSRSEGRAKAVGGQVQAL
jgi:hypothetical protein